MAITGTPYTPGTQAASWVAEVWDPEIDRLCYQRAKLLPLITTKKPLMGKLHVMKHANLTPTTVASTVDLSGHGTTFVANTETEFTATPGTITLNVSINRNTILRMVSDPTDTFKESIEMAMAQKIDQDIAGLFPSFTTNISGSYVAPMGKSDFLDCMVKVQNGAGEYADNGLAFAYHTLVGDSVLNIDAFVSAAFRGVTSKSPATDGVIPMAFGPTFVPCGNIQTSGGGYANAIIAKRGIAISFNQRPSVKEQEFGHALWLLCLADYGYGTVRDQYCGLLKSA